MSWRNLLASIFGDFCGGSNCPGCDANDPCQESGRARVSGLLLRENRSLLGSQFQDDRPDLTGESELTDGGVGVTSGQFRLRKNRQK
jgi:hypothetical protein